MLGLPPVKEGAVPWTSRKIECLAWDKPYTPVPFNQLELGELSECYAFTGP
jgi:hypothetical protein